MRTRNILAALAASVAFATVAAAQQSQPPAKPAQHKSAAASATGAPHVSDVKVSADSARRIVMANVPGATVKSERLRHAAGRPVYVFRLTEEKGKEVLSATVDAETGAYTRVVPSKATSHKTTTAKKP